ncbi:hypothetical protein [Vibrio sp. 1180_3]|uniref:hypothetical protein n=1 Tax=Vibrio sp. 1180_3 TaxID=2528832 RepID=UPI002406228B|nr:hypothetical protein [Vibrio sp. 1180_3]MDF9399138.1 hypothetical protein [Vibrio sp. 1180_3]
MKLSFLENLSIKFTAVSDKINLLEDIANLLSGDMAIIDVALDLSEFGQPIEKLVGKRMYYAIRNTKPIYTAFEGIVSEITLQTIKAGEESHDLASGFLRAKEALEASEGLIGKLLKAFIIPGVKLLCVFLATGAIGNYVFSQLTMMTPLGRWPSISQMYYHYSQFLYENSIAIILGTLSLPIVVYVVVNFVHGPIRNRIDMIPFFKQYRLMSAGATLSTMATLLNANLSTLKMLQFLKGRTTRYCRYHLALMESNVTNNVGKGNIGYILDTGLIDARENNRLKRASGASTVGDRLQASANEHNLKLKRQIDKINSITTTGFLVLLYSSLLGFFSAVVFLVLSINTM